VRLSLNCGHQWPLWNNTDRGRKKNSERNLSQWHFVHRKSHIDWHGSEPGPPLWEPSEPWHGQPGSKAREPVQSVISNRFNECQYQSVKKLKLSQYTPLRRLGGEEVYLLRILDLGTRWGWVVSVTSRPHFSPGVRTPGTHCTGGWVGPRAGLDTMARGKILSPLSGIEPRSPGRPALSQTQYWVSYPGSQSQSVVFTNHGKATVCCFPPFPHPFWCPLSFLSDS
jgi:hypothetical protein